MPNPASKTPSTSPADFFGARAAEKIGGAFVLALLGIVAFSVLDLPKKVRLEQFSQVTAVGDTRYYDPTTAVPNTPILSWEGREMAVAGEKLKLDDTVMVRVYRDDATGFTVYRPAESKDHARGFVKIAVSEYLPLVPAP